MKLLQCYFINNSHQGHGEIKLKLRNKIFENPDLNSEMRDSSLQPELNEGNKIRLVTIKPNDLKAGLRNRSRA